MHSVDAFDAVAAACSTRTAFLDHRTQRAFTYQDVHTLSRHVANGLTRAGFAGEFTVAIGCPNDARLWVCLLGVMRAGGVIAPVSVGAAPASIVEHLRFIGADCAFFHRELAERVEPLAARVPTLRAQQRIDDVLAGDLSPHAPGNGAGNGAGAAVDAQRDPDRLLAVYQTGGTTGTPRTVPWTALQWATQVRTNAHYLRGRLDATTVPVNLVATPFAHRTNFVIASLLALGATTVFMPNLDPAEVLRAIPRYGVTHLWVPPSGLYLLLAHPKVRTLDYSSLRYLMLGSAPVAPDLLREAVDVFGPVVCQSYGQTETGVLTWMDPAAIAEAIHGSAAHRLRSCGRPVYSIELAVVDDGGHPLSRGTTGEIAVRGASVSRARSVAPGTGRTPGDEWHRTSDVGYVDDDGYVYLVDRTKDVVLSGGVTVYSLDVERAVTELGGIADCAVIGVPDPVRGEAVKAIVVPRGDGRIVPEIVIRHCRRRLGVDASPVSVEVVDGLPRTSTGKTDKRALRARYAQAFPRA